jgi:hypothetical protein
MQDTQDTRYQDTKRATHQQLHGALGRGRLLVALLGRPRRLRRLRGRTV